MLLKKRAKVSHSRANQRHAPLERQTLNAVHALARTDQTAIRQPAAAARCLSIDRSIASHPNTNTSTSMSALNDESKLIIVSLEGCHGAYA